jgi:hypothetical protein
MTTGDASLDQVLALEARLLNADTRRDRGELESLLHPGFCEITVSGRLLSRGEAIAELTAEPRRHHAAGDFAARAVSPDIVLITYTAGASRRSSLWVRDAHSWGVAFH